jgi:hypothetical protein
MRLLGRFLPLTPADLDGWMADPEEWLNLEDTESEQWEYQLRVCLLLCVPCRFNERIILALRGTGTLNTGSAVSG